MKQKFTSSLLIVLSILAIVSMTASAAATTKSLSTNFTLVNLGSADAQVTVEYIKPDGSPWTGSTNTSKTITEADGNQWVVRQYFDSLTPGSGSVRISSSELLGSMVQIVNRSGTPTSGAYTGVSSGSQVVYIPQVARNANSATGVVKSQIMIQNTGDAAINVAMTFYQGSATPANSRTSPNIQPGATYFYDLTNDTAAPALANGWYSVKLDAGSGNQIAAVVNNFFGSHGLMTYNGFPSSKVASKWFIPLFYSKLANTLNTSLVIQNLDSSEIPANDIVLSCTDGTTDLTVPYTSAVAINGSASYNTYTDSRFPATFQGSCDVTSTSGMDVVLLVSYRYINSPDQAAYEGIPATATDTTVFVPLVAKRLSNKFATTATIQNLDPDTTATVKITYKPTGGGTDIVRNLTIDPGRSIVRNFRLASTELPEMTDGWQGSMTVESNTPIAAYVANTYLTVNGDQFMAYLGITQP